MGRWRPPRPRGSRYITPEGARRMRAEVKQLWEEERPRVTNAVSEAAKLGDRSENADYIYGKKRLREIDSRVRFLTKRLEEVTVVDRIPEDREKVFFGAWVDLEDEKGNTLTYRIVGPDEFDVKRGLISMDSPVARRLLGRRLDDEVDLKTGEEWITYYVVEIRYEG
ncbi:transcription elongation factor GreB [Microbulbifer flavimaris]|uniref:Transcription elongation factor GreB n=1 Tax=Microbulbifer flavimaris TaxID=1781068 RepID=A0ABX4I2P4_9GAMM|nr:MULTISPECIES: transcription elongation factor GreB [Microbulbifer]KUJ84603.1 transcription elongation factor GreB [Microbulbifer sp. ZGT114]PCO06690.1 transcription elongation factor GreB [Microbulbifer flavimaris]